MLMVISPAKTLDFETPAKTKVSTQPDFLDQSQLLIDQLRELSPSDISGLMSISDKLGNLNFDRFLNWHTPFDVDNAKQAVLAFKGDVYTGLDAESFNGKDFKFAQKHLRILSGLYGLLRPLDYIQPYRLEMGTKFANEGGDNLYQFWGEQITDAMNAQLKKSNSEVLLNLASNEYFKSIQQKNINADIITPVFKDLKNGKYKIISFYAKKARGLMSAYVIKNQLTDVEDIKQFDTDGYRYNAAMSSAREWVFTRDEPA
ncbi:MAG: peroxide stress protein YaaA [Oceanicoccus sp.]|uniref:peroxide stress protein YaaA n=1 Tax=Oceanicoccus sp. TaxID=2691044 RepID=UPI00260B12FB|nr:peroxide stress protein YaaA [Oceanicoccus sp.]MDG1772153.1 peroxide stress protein YaaA [Oceanicoccus sp.]